MPELPVPPPAGWLVERDVRRALEEDIGPGDLSAALVPEGQPGVAELLCREQAVLCGRPWFAGVFRALDPGVEIHWQAAEGDSVAQDAVVCELRGPARVLLTGERSAMNFLQALSGVATAARRFARAVEDFPAVVLDTRKTLPGLRVAQKYAVAQGGCRNHRMGLYDAILVKENHIVAAGSIGAAVSAARTLYPRSPLQVEVENLAQLEEALAAGVSLVLLDNFSLEGLRQAVALAASHEGGQVRLEASGGVDLESLSQVASSGVDFISVGALTKDLRAVDFSLRFQS